MTLDYGVYGTMTRTSSTIATKQFVKLCRQLLSFTSDTVYLVPLKYGIVNALLYSTSLRSYERVIFY